MTWATFVILTLSQAITIVALVSIVRSNRRTVEMLALANKASRDTFLEALKLLSVLQKQGETPNPFASTSEKKS